MQEVILIGPSDSDVCGHTEKNWGLVDDKPLEVSSNASNVKHGFKRVDLDKLSARQICRIDMPPDFYNSCTVSFRRLG